MDEDDGEVWNCTQHGGVCQPRQPAMGHTKGYFKIGFERMRGEDYRAWLDARGTR